MEIITIQSSIHGQNGRVSPMGPCKMAGHPRSPARPPMSAVPVRRDESPATAGVDWPRVVHTALVSRALDELEETRLVPARKVLYQFTSRGHDVTQALLAQHLTGARDGISSYYRSRPLLLALGLSIDEALASTMMRTG